MHRIRSNLKAAVKYLRPQVPSTKEACEADMLQNRPINNRSTTSHSEAEEEDQEELAKTTGLEARAKRRKREKVGLATEEPEL